MNISYAASRERMFEYFNWRFKSGWDIGTLKQHYSDDSNHDYHHWEGEARKLEEFFKVKLTRISIPEGNKESVIKVLQEKFYRGLNTATELTSLMNQEVRDTITKSSSSFPDKIDDLLSTYGDIK